VAARPVGITRRTVLERAAALSAWAALRPVAPAFAWTETSGAALPLVTQAGSPAGVIDLTIAAFGLPIDGRTGSAMAVNGTVPGPLIRLREGQDAVLRVTNRLNELASIHWHGVILPPDMDGVPGVSFAGIKPGETFTYRFPIRQSGTYWAHSHSGGQELLGVYFPLIIDPAEREPFAYDRDYVVMLSDWSFESPAAIISKLKKQSGYYNFQKRTLADFVDDVQANGMWATIKERASWAKMNMDPTDFADVTGYTYTYLLNGLTPNANWTGLFTPGERVRLRFIDAAAMTLFDVRIPGLKLRVVQADGQNVQPVEVDEFRIGPGETYDVIVEPGDRAYTVFAESLDRSGYTRGTLAARSGMTATVPPLRPRPVRTMADMGMDMSGMEGMPGMDAAATPGDTSGHGAHGLPAIQKTRTEASHARGAAHEAGAAGSGLIGPALPGSAPVMHNEDTHGAGNASIAMVSRSRVHEPGSGLEGIDSRVLVYADLKSLAPYPDRREPAREIELHITGNMQRYMWSFDGRKYSEAKTPIPFHYGERLRLVLVNDTMMEHPIHLHGMWMELENGTGEHQPRKHTVTVKPAERMTLAITADAPGRWAMHCHLLLHMEMGMFRVVEVSPAPGGTT
jgi:CopA family copper-resistance protein